jgi:hypothetical protein
LFPRKKYIRNQLCWNANFLIPLLAADISYFFFNSVSRLQLQEEEEASRAVRRRKYDILKLFFSVD